MNSKNSVRLALVATFSLILAACGSSNTKPQSTGTVSATSATIVRAGTSALTIYPGALPAGTQVTLREADPRVSGRQSRVEIEIEHGLVITPPAALTVKVDDKNVKVKMHATDDGAAEHLAEVELEDANHHEFKTSVSKSGSVEVELEHGLACATACTATQECDDGVCKAHLEDPTAAVCDPVCTSGQECDNGLCKAHHLEPGPTPGTAICTPACASGLECDATNGVCKPHGGAA